MSQSHDLKDGQKALIAFIGILIAIAIMALTSCKKSSPAPAPASPSQVINCPNQDTTFLNKIWIPVDTFHANIQFKSDHSFIQNNVSFATWSVKGCDSLKLTRPTSYFYYRLIFISPDTLVIGNPLYGPLKYHL